MNIQFTTAARLQLESALVWLEQRSPAAADELSRQVARACELLELFPETGRLRFDSGIRSVRVRGFQYVLFYRVRRETVEILSIRHAARRPPKEPDLT